jgi:acyl carrier protein
MSIRSAITAQFTQVAAEQGKQLAPLNDDLPLLDSGLDSLGFATIIARLELALNVDPFSAAENGQFPVTFGELVRFYEQVSA